MLRCSLFTLALMNPPREYPLSLAAVTTKNVPHVAAPSQKSKREEFLAQRERLREATNVLVQRETLTAIGPVGNNSL